MDREQAEIRAGKERRDVLAEELRKAELVRDRLASLEEMERSYPEGHPTRALLADLDLNRPLRAVEEDIRSLWDRILHPRGS